MVLCPRLISANFYPRPPCGGRRWIQRPALPRQYFYPRPPCGGRLSKFRCIANAEQFLSTSPLRGTTISVATKSPQIQISIHVPLAGDDRCGAAGVGGGKIFLSTSPLRGTTIYTSSWVPPAQFLSTSPLRGTTANVTENTVYFPAHLSQQDTAYKNTLRFCAVCGRFRGASARSALKMLCSPVRTARRFSAR